MLPRPTTNLLPYGRQCIDEDDIAAVVRALRSDWLTTGPRVEEFESAFAAATGSPHAVALSSGTAALHAIMFGLGIGAGDEVILPAMTFAATANSVVYQGGTPIFADVSQDTLLLDCERVEEKITARTKGIVAVDYAGHPCNYERLQALAERYGVALVSDTCHALGAQYRGRPAGSLALMSAFSLHPVKHITTGEGGVVTTHDRGLSERLRRFRNHGITTDHRTRATAGAWFYEMESLGFNYRLTDIQSALGLSQLGKLDRWIERRRDIARRYDAAFCETETVRPLSVRADVHHAYHLYVVRLDLDKLGCSRDDIYRALRAQGIGVNVHYIPVHLHPYYRQRFGTGSGLCPVAEEAYERILSLPLFPTMTDADVSDVIEAVQEVVRSAPNETKSSVSGAN